MAYWIFLLTFVFVPNAYGISIEQIRNQRDLGPIPVSEGVAILQKSEPRRASPPSNDVVIIESEPHDDDNNVDWTPIQDAPLIGGGYPIPQAPPEPEEPIAPVAPAAPVTPPSPPPTGSRFCDAGFSVRKATRQSLEAPSRVTFQDVVTNAGGWDYKNNEFRPKCAGTYFFTFHGVSAKSDFTLALMKNDNYQVTAYGTKQAYESGSNSVLLFLNPGDVVYLQLQQGALYEHPYDEAYNTFTGFLVNKF